MPPHDCLRYTISESARLEILNRLSRLNRDQFTDEVNACGAVGWHASSKIVPINQRDKRPPRDMSLNKVTEPTPQMDIFGQEDE